MESLNPTLSLIIKLKRSMQKQESVIRFVQGLVACDDLELEVKDELALLIKIYQGSFNLGEIDKLRISLHRKAFYKLLIQGMKGSSIYESLIRLETEVQSQVDAELNAYLLKLPIKAMLPLVLLIFPAFLLLLIGPLLLDFLAQMSV